MRIEGIEGFSPHHRVYDRYVIIRNDRVESVAKIYARGGNQ
jgi:hypothetical protein